MDLKAKYICILPIFSAVLERQGVPFYIAGNGALVFFILAACFSSSSPAAEPPGQAELTLSLPETVLLAVRNNRAVKSAYLERVVQKFSLEVSEDMFSPKGSIGASVSRSSGDSGTYRDWQVGPGVNWKIPTGAEFNFTWTNVGRRDAVGSQVTSNLAVSVIQPLLKGGGWNVNMAPLLQARNDEQNNILGLRATLSTTISASVLAFRNLILAKGQLEIQHNALERAEQLVRINQALIENGRMASQEQVQAEADVATRELTLASAENNLDSARLALLALLALDKHTRIAPSEPMSVPDHRLDAEALQVVALSNRTDYLQARLGLQNLQLAKTLAEDGRNWQLDLSASATQARYSDRPGLAFGGAPVNDRVIGLQLNIPLFDKSRDLSPLRARISLEKAEIALADLRESIEREVLDGVRDARIKHRQVDLARRALKLTEQKLSIERAKFSAGRSNNFQVVQYENDLVIAQNQELSAILDYLNALTQLDEILGTTLDTWKIKLEP